jgi:hypothetical protein
MYGGRSLRTAPVCQLRVTAAVVREHFAHWMGHFGVPKIVQIDNGGEFKSVLEELLHEQGTQIIHGLAKHSQ